VRTSSSKALTAAASRLVVGLAIFEEAGRDLVEAVLVGQRPGIALLACATRMRVDPSQLSRPGGRAVVGNRPASRGGPPTKEAPPVIAGRTAHGDDRSPELTVLVADDDDQTRSFVAENLAADRYRIRTADSREKALAILSRE
jgi:hypothetical protein